MEHDYDRSTEDAVCMHDILGQLDQCIDAANTAKCTGDWTAAHTNKQKLDKLKLLNLSALGLRLRLL